MKQALRTCVWGTLLLLFALGGVWAQQQPRPLKLKIQADKRGEVCPCLYAKAPYEIEYYEEGHESEKKKVTLGLYFDSFQVTRDKIYYLTIPPEKIVRFGSEGYRYLFEIQQWGDVKWETFKAAFQGHEQLSISATDTPDLSLVRDMSYAFFGCENFNSPNLCQWDVSHVEDMSLCFYRCYTFNRDLSAWHVENVRDMPSMFNEATSFSHSLAAWGERVQQVRNCWEIFEGSAFNESLGGWKLKNLERLHIPSNMSHANYVKTLQGWSKMQDNELARNVKIYALGKSYHGAEEARLKLIAEKGWTFEGDYGVLNPPSGTAPFVLEYRVEKASQLVVPVLGQGLAISWKNVEKPSQSGGINHLNAALVKDFYRFEVSEAGTYEVRIAPAGVYTFQWGKSENYDVALTVRQWGSVAWGSVASMFEYCSDLTIAPEAGNPDLSHVTSLEKMFSWCENFNSDISGWDVSRVQSMERLFMGCRAFNQPLERWDVSSVISLEYTFSGCRTFNQPLNGWGKKMKALRDATGVFHFCTRFNQPLDQWDVSQVLSLHNIFSEATAFNQDLSSWKPTALDQYSNIGLSRSGLSRENYSKLLIAWASLMTTKNVELEAQGLKFTPAAVSARTKLINELQWDISDDGLDSNTPTFAIAQTLAEGVVKRNIRPTVISSLLTDTDKKAMTCSNENVKWRWDGDILSLNTSVPVNEQVTFTIPANSEHGALSASLTLRVYHDAAFSVNARNIYLQYGASTEQVLTFNTHNPEELTEEEKKFAAHVRFSNDESAADYLEVTLTPTPRGAKAVFKALKPTGKQIYVDLYTCPKSLTTETVRVFLVPEVTSFAFENNPLTLRVGEKRSMGFAAVIGGEKVTSIADFNALGGLNWEVKGAADVVKYYGDGTVEALKETAGVEIEVETQALVPKQTATLKVRVEAAIPGHKLVINHSTLADFSYSTEPKDISSLQPGTEVYISILSEQLDLTAKVTGNGARVEEIANGRSYRFVIGTENATLTFTKTPPPTYELSVNMGNTGLFVEGTAIHALNQLLEGEVVTLKVDNPANKELVVSATGVAITTVTPNKLYKVTMGRQNGVVTFNLKPERKFPFSVDLGTTGLAYKTEPANCTELAYGASVKVTITNPEGKKLVTTLNGAQAELDVLTPNSEYRVTMGTSGAVLKVGFAVEPPTYSVEIDDSALGSGLTVITNPPSLQKLDEGTKVRIWVYVIPETQQLVAKVTEGGILAERMGRTSFSLKIAKTNVKVKLSLEEIPQTPKPKYNVELKSGITGGSVYLSHKNDVEVGTVVTISYQAAPDYKPHALVVYRKDKPTETVTVENGKFVMPDFDVEVNVTFVSKKHNIEIGTGITGGTVSTSPSGNVLEGTRVQIVAVPNNPATHRLLENSVRVTPRDPSSSLVVNVLSDLSFIMPEEDVVVTATFVTTGHVEPSYDIEITQDANGTITTSPSGKAKKDEEVIITMVGNQDYMPNYTSLSVKEKNGAQTSVRIYEQNKFRMPAADVVVTGTFVGKTYELTTQTENGILTLSTARAAKSETVTVTHKAATGYKLLEGSLKYHQKTDKTVEVSITGNTFSMPAFDVVVTAEFVSTRHNIVLTTAVNGLLKSAPERYAHEGTTVTISGVGATGYTLEMASIVVTKLGDPNTKVTVVNGAFTMPDYDVEVKGEFKEISTLHTVTIENKTPDGGSITASPNTDVAKGTTVTIVETHNAGYELDKTKLVVYKKGDPNTKVSVNLEKLTFEMSDYDVVVKGEFKEISTLHTVTIENKTPDGGSITASPNTDVAKGTTVTIVETHNAGYELDKTKLVVYKKGDPNTKVTVTDNTFEMPDYDVVVKGEFKEISTLHTITIENKTPDRGSITASPNTDVAKGTTVTIVETHNAGYELDKTKLVVYKKGDPNTKVSVNLENLTFVMPDYDVVVSGEFDPKSYAVTVKEGIEYGQLILAAPTAKFGETVTITVTSDEGYNLKPNSLVAYKKDSPSEKVEIVNLSFTMPAFDVEVTAEFEAAPKHYKVNLAVTGKGTLVIKDYTAAQLESVPANTTLTVLATPDTGYELTALTAGGVSILETKTLTVTGEVTVIATFTETNSGKPEPNKPDDGQKDPLAVEDASLAGVTVAPNPFTNQLRIVGNGLAGEYALLNLQGQVLRSGRLDAMETTVVTEELSAGLYLLRLSVEGATKTLRVVKE